MYKGKSITVVIPCLDEEKAIGAVLEQMPAYVDEVIVVDNNSSDRTAEIARARGARVVMENLRGYGRAYQKGFACATGDIIITLDGDQSYPLDAISYLLEAFFHLNVGFVSASRFPVQDAETMSWKHRMGNRVLSLVMSLLWLRWVRDSQSGMWVFRRQALGEMKLESEGMAFSEEIKIEALRNRRVGFREIFILYSTRIGEKKLRPWRDGMVNLLFLLKKRFWR